MKPTLLIAAALLAATLPAAAQDARPLDRQLPAVGEQTGEDHAHHSARRRWNAAHEDDRHPHARRRWNAAIPPQADPRPHRPELTRPMVHRIQGGGERER